MGETEIIGGYRNPNNREELQCALDYIKKRDPKIPLIVIGDFNTPVHPTTLTNLNREGLPTWRQSGTGSGDKGIVLRESSPDWCLVSNNLEEKCNFKVE